jgi:uncharacterized membrane protein
VKTLRESRHAANRRDGRADRLRIRSLVALGFLVLLVLLACTTLGLILFDFRWFTANLWLLAVFLVAIAVPHALSIAGDIEMRKRLDTGKPTRLIVRDPTIPLAPSLETRVANTRVRSTALWVVGVFLGLVLIVRIWIFAEQYSATRVPLMVLAILGVPLLIVGIPTLLGNLAMARALRQVELTNKDAALFPVVRSVELVQLIRATQPSARITRELVLGIDRGSCTIYTRTTPPEAVLTAKIEVSKDLLVGSGRNDANSKTPALLIPAEVESSAVLLVIIPRRSGALSLFPAFYSEAERLLNQVRQAARGSGA